MPGLAGLAVNPQMGSVGSMPQAQCGERPGRQGEPLRLDTMPSSTGHHRYSHANASKMPAMRPARRRWSMRRRRCSSAILKLGDGGNLSRLLIGCVDDAEFLCASAHEKRASRPQLLTRFLLGCSHTRQVGLDRFPRNARCAASLAEGVRITVKTVRERQRACGFRGVRHGGRACRINCGWRKRPQRTAVGNERRIGPPSERERSVNCL